MTKYYLSILLVSFLLVVLVSGEENKNENIDAESEDNYEAELVKTIRRGLLAELLLKQRLAAKQQAQPAENDNNDSVSDSEEDPELVKRLQKRYPKWRTGETRSKVKLLYNHDHVPAHSAAGSEHRKVWEKNLAEKNKMYQNLLG